MIHNANGFSQLGVREEPINKNIQNPPASTGVGLNPGRMEDLGSEITAEEAPEWAIRGGVDIMLVARGDLADGKCRWTVGEESAV